jgi:hypothetical protein
VIATKTRQTKKGAILDEGTCFDGLLNKSSVFFLGLFPFLFLFLLMLRFFRIPYEQFLTNAQPLIQMTCSFRWGRSHQTKADEKIGDP